MTVVVARRLSISFVLKPTRGLRERHQPSFPPSLPPSLPSTGDGPQRQVQRPKAAVQGAFPSSLPPSLPPSFLGCQSDTMIQAHSSFPPSLPPSFPPSLPPFQSYGDLTAAGVEVLSAELATADVKTLLVRAPPSLPLSLPPLHSSYPHDLTIASSSPSPSK